MRNSVAPQGLFMALVAVHTARTQPPPSDQCGHCSASVTSELGFDVLLQWQIASCRAGLELCIADWMAEEMLETNPAALVEGTATEQRTKKNRPDPRYRHEKRGLCCPLLIAFLCGGLPCSLPGGAAMSTLPCPATTPVKRGKSTSRNALRVASPPPQFATKASRFSSACSNFRSLIGERQKVGGRAAEQREIWLTMPCFIRSQNPIYGRLAKADLDSNGSSGSAFGG